MELHQEMGEVRAGRFDVVMDRGATFTRDLKWTIAGKPVNLKGYAGVLRVKPDYDSEQVLFDLTSENGEISFDADGGIHWQAPASETRACPAGLYVYDFFVSTEKEVIKLLEGTWRCKPSVIEGSNDE